MRALRTGLGFRVAMMIAAFAALCLVTPPAAMAFGHGSNIVHCLTHGDAVGHGMLGDVGHQGHDDHGKLPGTHAPGCCGLYGLSALPPAPGPMVEARLIEQALSAPIEIAVYGRVPERLDRPPISLLSV